MNLYLKGFLYRILIDPLLAGVRASIVEKTGQATRVIDVACGTGRLALALAAKAGHVTGIDLDDKLISYASGRANKKGIKNILFEVKDATDLSCYRDREFDIALTSMAVHQFDELVAVKILREMKRIAPKVIIADYNSPMPAGFSRSLAYGIERIASGDHHRNFINYIAKGGIRYFTNAAGLSIKSSTVRGNGVFITVF